MLIEEIPKYTSGKKIGQYKLNVKIKLKCDDCCIEFLRLSSLVLKNTERCRRCLTILYNKTRDPLIHEKMVKNAAKTWKGKTREEVCGVEKARAASASQSAKNSGKNNPNYGGKYSRGWADNPTTGKWEDRFGKEEADRRKAAVSKRVSGSGNPMYGKSSPKKSGNGISGWWKDKLYFRSLLELALILKFESEGKVLFSAEKKKFRVKYEFYGVQRTYVPDFIDENGVQYECKPIKLLSSEIVKAKMKAAPYVVMITDSDITRPRYCDLKFLIDSGHVIIDKSKIERMEKWAKI